MEDDLLKKREYTFDKTFFGLTPVSSTGTSEWTCYLSGEKGVSGSVVFVPVKGYEPNRFHRFMQ